MNLATLVDEYLLDVARLYQPATERKYGQVLAYLLRDCGEKTPIDSITESDILRSLYRWKDKKPATKALHTSVYRKCFEYAVEKDYLTVSPAAKIKRPRIPRAEDREVVIVSTDDIRRMFSSCQNWGDEICLGILAYTGSRRTAVSQLRWRDVDLTPDPPHGPHGWIRFREKSQKVIDKPIPFFLREIIDRAPEHTEDDYLVPNYRPWQVSRKERQSQVIYRRVKNLAERAGVEAHVHAIRAAFAVFFLENHRGNIKSLQMWLGHERLETTQHYTRGLDKKQLMAEGLGLDWGSALNGAGETQLERTLDVPGGESPAPLSALSEGNHGDAGQGRERVADSGRAADGVDNRHESPQPMLAVPSESTLEVEERVT